MRRHKTILAFVPLLLALAVMAGCNNETETTGKKTTTQQVTRGDLVIGLGADGRVALPVSNLNFGVAGTVSSIYVSVGDSVKAGDLLAELDDSSYQFAISNARNNLTKAETAYDIAVSQYDYSILNDEKELNKLQRSINDGFDDYTYQNLIADARVALQRKQDELANAEARAKSPFDSYQYDIQIEDAERTVAIKQREFDAAERALMDSDGEDETINKNYETAKDALTTANTSLDRLNTEKERARTQAQQDADTQVKIARQAVSDAQKNLQIAQSNLSRARSDYNRQVADTGVDLQLKRIDAEMNKNSNSSISNAEFALEEARLNLEEAEKNLDQVKLYASIDGQILSISRSIGETVSEQSGPSGVIFFGTGDSSGSFMTLCDVTEIYLTASITEGDIINVSTGQTIQVTIDAIGGDVFYGFVSNIDNIPSTDANGITTYTVTCRLMDTTDDIKDGMNAYITFVQREFRDVLLIPNRAVFMENEQQYVNVVNKNGSYEKRKVVCGISNGVQTEVTSGLKAGETVLVGRPD